MRLHDSHARQLRPLIEALEDRLLLAGNLTLPEFIQASTLVPIESFSAAVLLTDAQPRAGAKPLTVLHKVDAPTTLWHYPVDGRLRLGNHPPKAVDDSVSTDSGTPLKIDVRANDTDPDGDSLYVLYSTKPDHGTLFRDSAHPNNFIYQPDKGYVGTDSFTYSVYDHWGDSDEATVHILVRPSPVVASENRPPVARSDSAWTHAGRAVTIDVLHNDSDPDGDKVKLTGIVLHAGHGLAKTHAGMIVYTPNAKFVGDDSFTYQITDGHGGTAWARVTVHVTNKPVVARDDHATTHPGELFEINVLANDHDGNGDPLHIVSFTQPAGGVITRVGNQLVFTPKAGFSGQTSFSYIAGDPFGSQSRAVVRIDVSNRPPVANTDFAIVHENKPVTINVLANDRDRDGDRLHLVSVAPTSRKGGTVQVDPSNPQRVRYTPKAGFTGLDEFTYQIDDGHGGHAVGTVFVFVMGNGPIAHLSTAGAAHSIGM